MLTKYLSKLKSYPRPIGLEISSGVCSISSIPSTMLQEEQVVFIFIDPRQFSFVSFRIYSYLSVATFEYRYYTNGKPIPSSKYMFHGCIQRMKSPLSTYIPEITIELHYSTYPLYIFLIFYQLRGFDSPNMTSIYGQCNVNKHGIFIGIIFMLEGFDYFFKRPRTDFRGEQNEKKLEGGVESHFFT